MSHSHDHTHCHSHVQHAHSAEREGQTDTANQAPRLVGERSTRQRAAIRMAMVAEGRPMTPPEILEAAKQHVPKLGIATVYRNIKAMVDAGEIATVPLPGDRLYYELAHCAEHHHHHFRCNQCERVFDVLGCSDGFASLVPDGFKVQSHDLTLYGVCAECSAAAQAGSAA